MQEGKGPACYEVFSNHFVENIFHQIERLFNSQAISQQALKGEQSRRMTEIEM